MMRRAWKALLLVLGFLAAIGLYIEFQMHSDALPRYGKGGIGIIGKDTYVLTRGRQNTVQKNNWNPWWRGDFAGKRQTVFSSTVIN
jgi:hypothetical protein